MITPGHLLFVTVLLSAFMLILIVYMTFSLIAKNRIEKEKKRWLVKINFLITKAIFFEDEDDKPFHIRITHRISDLLKKPLFRQLLINELVTSSNNLVGVASENLSKLYQQLELEKDSEKNLKKSRWHKKAKAIKELATMQLNEFSPALYKLTNNKNEYIRMESQTSIVKFHGFEGLDFLNTITYPLSEWHQINLLKELSNLPASDFQGIENWLKSSNDTVIIFALKLCASYHQFQMYDKIVECLKHPNPKVRLQAIKCLKEVYEDSTAWHLMSVYNNEEKSHQLAILLALKEIASSESISFLRRQLDADDNQIKIAATRALFNCGLEGEDVIETHPSATVYPLSEIIQQIRTERK
jgi:hypothetical protein